MEKQRACCVLAFLVGALVSLQVYSSLDSATRTESSERQEPWVLYKDGYQAKQDGEALRQLLMDRCGAGVGVGGGYRELEVLLGHEADSKTRNELLSIVTEIDDGLPRGHPFTISVQTLDDAIADHENWITRLKNELETMKRIHASSAAHNSTSRHRAPD